MANKKTARIQKKAVKGSRTVPMRASMAIRAFALSHVEGYGQKELKFLDAYLRDNYGVALSAKELQGRIRKETVRHIAEQELKEIDSFLFSKDKQPPEIKLGSSFCPQCGMFKNFRKECPYCGFLEMTV